MIDTPVKVKTSLGLAMDKFTDISPEYGLAEQYAAALDWWRDAGVDCDYVDTPENWLGRAEAETPAPSTVVKTKAVEPAPFKPVISPADLPDTLAAFRDWWMAPESPLPRTPAPRIAPRGQAGAALAIIVPMPERDDRDALLSAAQGRFLANIAQALSLDPDTIYHASALPSHLTLPDWAELQREGLGTALARHIALAKPQRVILFGSPLPLLLGHDPAAAPDSFSSIEGIPALATFAPDRLLDHPRQRARFWQRLLAWTSA